MFSLTPQVFDVQCRVDVVEIYRVEHQHQPRIDEENDNLRACKANMSGTEWRALKLVIKVSR
jgi:hypothetical protein